MSEQIRTSISIDPQVAALAQRVAETERRSFSQLCEIALDEYIRARGGFTAAEEAAAVTEAKEAGVDVVAVLKSAARRRKRGG